MDAPKTLANEAERAARSAMLSLPHVHGLAQFVQRMREAKGPDHAIPDFDPLDGGADARLLYLLEAPGRRAVASGLISRNNPDEPDLERERRLLETLSQLFAPAVPPRR